MNRALRRSGASASQPKMARRFQHVPVAGPDVRKSGGPRRYQMRRIAGADINRTSERPQSLMDVPQKRLGKRNHRPGPCSTCDRNAAAASSIWLRVSSSRGRAVNGAGYLRNAKRRRIKRRRLPNKVAHRFRVRIVKVAFDDVRGIEIIHQARSRLSETKRPLSS